MVERVAGTNRYRTAVEISKKAFAPYGSADVVYVATGLGFADALAAAPAAAAGNGPVLLVPGTSLPQEVADEILRLTPYRVVVVGGTSVVSDAVLTALDALQDGDIVERIAGTNRYNTAVAISEDAFPGGSEFAYIATGLNFPDALAGAAAAGARGAPVLLVPGSSLPAEVSAEITRLGAQIIVILGGTGVVSTGVEDALKTLIGAD
jgi:putative cell wall-binding protein